MVGGGEWCSINQGTWRYTESRAGHVDVIFFCVR